MSITSFVQDLDDDTLRQQLAEPSTRLKAVQSYDLTEAQESAVLRGDWEIVLAEATLELAGRIHRWRSAFVDLGWEPSSKSAITSVMPTAAHKNTPTPFTIRGWRFGGSGEVVFKMRGGSEFTFAPTSVDGSLTHATVTCVAELPPGDYEVGVRSLERGRAYGKVRWWLNGEIVVQ